MDAKSNQVCQLLDWDTRFFGRRIARVTQAALTNGILEAALEWCRQERISCLYYLAPSGDIESIHLAEASGFNLVDIRLTFELRTNSIQPQEEFAQIRPVQTDDIPALMEIARMSFQNTRFFNDRNFPTEQSEKLYMTWIEQSCKGYAQAVWVACTASDTPIGFITCHLKEKTGQIGLVGIHPDHHQQGWGGKLVSQALNLFASTGCTSVIVVTQGNNLSAQRLYQKCGFHTASVELWYHRWFTSNDKLVLP